MADAVAPPAVQELYALLERLRVAARSRQPAWAAYPAFTRYADVCFWAIRKLEYAFTVDAFTRLERTSAGRSLDVLDVGCGVVPLCNWIARRGHTVTAIDESRADIGFLVRNDLNAFYGSQVAYRVARAERLDLPDASVDVVTCVSVLEHLPPGNDRVALSEMARVLRPGGQLILTFDISPPPIPHDGDQPWPPDWRRYNQPFAPAAARRLLETTGSAFESWPRELIDQLTHLTWDDVFAFWRAAREHDANREDVRDYLACGLVLQRRPGGVGLSGTDVLEALLEGQAALAERVAFHETHALARLALLRRAETAGGPARRLLSRLSLAPSGPTPEPRQYAPRPLRVPPRYARTAPPRPAPRIALVTPSLNQGQFLEQTLLSVQRQTYPELEYLVQDGGSIDSSPTILERYRSLVSACESRPDNGVAQALNLAFSRTTGDLMGWISADDLLLPGALAAVARFFVAHPEVDVVYGQRVVIDAAGQEVGRWVLPPDAHRWLRWANLLPREGVFWRRAVWERAGAHLDERLGEPAASWDLLLRFQRQGARFARLPRFLGAVRLHLHQHPPAPAEVDLVRQRYLGRAPSSAEVDRALRPLLRRQQVWDRLYRWGVLRY